MSCLFFYLSTEGSWLNIRCKSGENAVNITLLKSTRAAPGISGELYHTFPKHMDHKGSIDPCDFVID